MRSKSIIRAKSKLLALGAIEFGEVLRQARQFEMANQVIRSGTSIGANLAEAVFAASNRDFINIHRISLKEAKELEYWFEICQESPILPEAPAHTIELNQECIRILVAIINNRLKSTQ